jgi:hypothetical protein
MMHPRLRTHARFLDLRNIAFVAIATLAIACDSTRSVKLAWDAPAVMPDRYHVFVDVRLVMDIPPPPVDRSCNCLTVTIPVPRGEHVLRIEACNPDGQCTPSAEVIAR